MYSYGSPHMAAQKQGDQLERTFSSYVRIQDVVLKTYLGRWTIGRSGERGSRISVLPARYNDDDDDDDDDDDFDRYAQQAVRGERDGHRLTRFFSTDPATTSSFTFLLILVLFLRLLYNLESLINAPITCLSYIYRKQGLFTSSFTNWTPL